MACTNAMHVTLIVPSIMSHRLSPFMSTFSVRPLSLLHHLVACFYASLFIFKISRLFSPGVGISYKRREKFEKHKFEKQNKKVELGSGTGASGGNDDGEGAEGEDQEDGYWHYDPREGFILSQASLLHHHGYYECHARLKAGISNALPPDSAAPPDGQTETIGFFLTVMRKSLSPNKFFRKIKDFDMFRNLLFLEIPSGLIKKIERRRINEC